MVYCVWIEDVPDSLREHPRQWRDHLDKIMAPKLSPEEKAEQDAELAAAEAAKLDREWATWGESPEQLESQRRFMAEFGGEEG